MESSMTLARLVGPTFIILALSILLSPNRIDEVGRRFLDDPGLLFTSAILAWVTGLAMVNAHNVWVWDWRVLLTLVGWITLIAGVARLLFPQAMLGVGKEMLGHRALVVGPALIMLGIGALLSYQGYVS